MIRFVDVAEVVTTLTANNASEVTYFWYSVNMQLTWDRPRNGRRARPLRMAGGTTEERLWSKLVVESGTKSKTVSNGHGKERYEVQRDTVTKENDAVIVIS